MPSNTLVSGWHYTLRNSKSAFPLVRGGILLTAFLNDWQVRREVRSHGPGAYDCLMLGRAPCFWGP